MKWTQLSLTISTTNPSQTTRLHTYIPYHTENDCMRTGTNQGDEVRGIEEAGYRLKHEAKKQQNIHIAATPPA